MVNRNMLVWGFLLVIHFPCIGAETVYCIKESPCNVTKCFKMRDSVNVVCSSIQQTEHCSISGTRIKLKCDVQLQCFCNEEGPFELDGFPEIPVKDQSSVSMENEVHPEETKRYEGDLSTCEVPESNNTNRTESSGFSRTSWQIGVGVGVFAAVGVPVAILIILCHIRKNRGRLCSGCRRKDTERQGDPELGETGPQTPPLAEGQNRAELEAMHYASIKHSPRPVETQGQDACDGVAGRGADVDYSQVALKSKTKKGKDEDGEGPPHVLRPEEEPLVTGEMEGNPE